MQERNGYKMSDCKCKDGPTKVYADHILTSDPPQFPWICKECGEKGIDRGKVVPYDCYKNIDRYYRNK